MAENKWATGDTTPTYWSYFALTYNWFFGAHFVGIYMGVSKNRGKPPKMDGL